MGGYRVGGLVVEVSRGRRGKYDSGYRYCSRCTVFILTSNLKCPFCHTILRQHPRKRRAKLKIVKLED
ncbi:hypothetical protein HRbin01_01629 [archaeon HR01]|nr:hypothetical protein HRbin01_01629 [archaeon HR01]